MLYSWALKQSEHKVTGVTIVAEWSRFFRLASATLNSAACHIMSHCFQVALHNLLSTLPLQRTTPLPGAHFDTNLGTGNWNLCMYIPGITLPLKVTQLIFLRLSSMKAQSLV